MFKLMTDNQEQISAKRDGALYNIAVGNQDFIIKGLGGQMAMTQSGLVVSVQTGEAIIHGRHVTSESVNTITLPSNSSGYLVLRVDLSQPIGQEARLFATPTLTNEEINWGGVIYDMPLASFVSQSTIISSFTDLRKIKDDDETEILTRVLQPGNTNIEINSSRISQNSAISVYTSKFGVNPRNVVVSDGSVTLTFAEQTENIIVGVKVDGTY